MKTLKLILLLGLLLNTSCVYTTPDPDQDAPWTTPAAKKVLDQDAPWNVPASSTNP